MKSLLMILGICVAVTMTAPVHRRTNAIDAHDDSFDYTDNMVNVQELDADSFDYTDNMVNLQEVNGGDEFDYTDNAVNVQEIEAPDGKKLLILSPYADDVAAADAHNVLGE